MKKIRLKFNILLAKHAPVWLLRLKFSLLSLLQKASRKSYSQNAEDLVLEDIFKNKTGFYVDVGAYHPIKYSNTYKLYKKGWRGVTIDANPDVTPLFTWLRPRDTHICAAVGEKATGLLFHEFSDPAVNTFDTHQAEKFKTKEWLRYLGTRKVDVVPLDEILAKHVKENEKIEILDIDVEGHDLEVLTSNNWDKYRPAVIVVEDHNFTFETAQSNQTFLYLKEKGYLLKHFLKFSLIFIRNDC